MPGAAVAMETAGGHKKGVRPQRRPRPPNPPPQPPPQPPKNNPGGGVAMETAPKGVKTTLGWRGEWGGGRNIWML